MPIRRDGWFRSRRDRVCEFCSNSISKGAMYYRVAVSDEDLTAEATYEFVAGAFCSESCAGHAQWRGRSDS